MSSVANALKSYGLNEKEITVYLACTGKASLSAQEIADRTALSRQVVYDHMKRLINDGLIITFNAGTAVRYQATSPRRFLQNVEQKVSILKDALPEMERLQSFDSVPSTAEVHRGTIAMRNLLVEALTSKKELLWITDHVQAQEVFYAHDFHNLTLKRIATRTPLKIIIGATAIPRDQIPVWRTNPADFRETRIASIADGMKTTTIIYADKVIMMSMTPIMPQAIVIRDAEIAQTQKKMFLNVWGRAKKL